MTSYYDIFKLNKKVEVHNELDNIKQYYYMDNEIYTLECRDKKNVEFFLIEKSLCVCVCVFLSLS